MATILFGAFVLYVAAGLIVGAAFTGFGVTQVQPMPVSIPARLLLLPGSVALWPVVLLRWRRLHGVR